MKFFAAFFTILCMLLTSCGKPAAPESRPLAVCGVPPVAYLAERIAGSPVASILPEGRSPHDFSPQPGSIRNAVRAHLFLSSGMPFEEQLTKIIPPATVKTVDVASGVRRLPIEGHEHHHGRGSKAHAGHDDDHALDPHVWLSPANCRIIAANIRDAFIAEEPARKTVFEENFRKLDAELTKLDTEIRAGLAPYEGKTFLVYHPAFGYFAAAYGLQQKGIELDGREPSAARLAEIIRDARDQQVNTIFVQPQFNPASAAALARAIDGNVAETDPLQRDVIGNFRKIAETIIQGFREK